MPHLIIRPFEDDEPPYALPYNINEHRFRGWIKRNMHILDAYAKLALDMYATGKRRYGSKCIWEVLRYHHDLETQGDVRWRFCNDYTPYISRMLVRRFPQLEGFFRYRKTKARPIPFPNTEVTYAVRRKKADE